MRSGGSVARIVQSFAAGPRVAVPVVPIVRSTPPATILRAAVPIVRRAASPLSYVYPARSLATMERKEHFHFPLSRAKKWKAVALVAGVVGGASCVTALAEEEKSDQCVPCKIIKTSNTGLPLFPATESKISSLATPLDLEFLLKQYQPILNKQLEKNLREGVNACNYVRKHIKASSTHRCLYDVTSKEVYALNDDINNMRSDLLREFPHNPLDESGWRALRRGIGNCGEMAYAVFNSIAGLNLRVEVVGLSDKFKYKNGNHYFVVIDRLVDSNINDPRTWGENVVIADAWSGNVYLAHEIPSKLKNFRNFKGEYFLSPYNPECEKLESIAEYRPCEDRPRLR